MTYAPVIIPTLNRYEHFRQCLESLERCSGAEFTDVYVGLDFPPSDEYVEGWKKIDEYLAEKEKRNGFRSLTVFRRETNCGVRSASKLGNSALLNVFVSERYGTIIRTEDDNVFSPNFLEYINKGLERYADDPTVFAIVGYAHPYHFKHGDNNHYRHNTDMSAWGYGTWVNKRKEMYDFVKNGGMRKSLSPYKMYKALKHGWLRLYNLIYYASRTGHISMTDSAISNYLILNDKYTITPTISKVRNIGWDASGTSFKKGVPEKKRLIAQRHMSQPIDTAEHFEYEGDDQEYMDYNNKVAVRESDGYMSFFTFVGKLFALFNRGLNKTINKGQMQCQYLNDVTHYRI